MNQFDISTAIPRLGKRAEILASWYLRFNGYFPLVGFILHDAGKLIQPGGQLTEADLLAFRLPYTREIIKGEKANIIVKRHDILDVQTGFLDFIICEVSSEQCKFNWINEKGVNAENRSINTQFLEYVLRRFGWWIDDDKINHINCCLSTSRVYIEKQQINANETIHVRVRLLSIGVNPDAALPIQQITFADILNYMKCDLFSCYGTTDERKRIVSDHKQWDALIHEIYKRLLGHKQPAQSTEEIITWLFPSKKETDKQVG